MKKEKRLLWADVIRVVAIFLVVQAHIPLTPPQISDPFYWPVIVWTNVVRTCVPLFIMLSGALLLGKQENYKIFFHKRCLHVLIPWFVWTTIYVAYIYFFHHEQITSSLLKFFFSALLSYFWFLPMIFSIYLITPFLRIIVQHARRFDFIYLITLWVIVVSFLPFLLHSSLFPTYEPSVLLLPFQHSGYFILGYLLRNQFFSKRIVMVFIMLFILGVIPSSLGERFSNNFLAPGTLISSVGLFSLLFVFTQKVTPSIKPFFRYILMLLSKAALGIYLSHGIVFDVTKGNSITVFFTSALFIILLQTVTSFSRKKVMQWSTKAK